MLIFSYFWLNIMVKLALTGLNVLSMINFCYFPKDFLGLSVLTSQKVEKMPKKQKKTTFEAANMLIFAYFSVNYWRYEKINVIYCTQNFKSFKMNTRLIGLSLILSEIYSKS